MEIALFIVSNDFNRLKSALYNLKNIYGSISITVSTFVSKFNCNDKLVININGKNIPIVKLKELSSFACDYILVVGGESLGMSVIKKIFAYYNIHSSNILYDWIVCLPGFSIKKYDKLCKSKLSIISQNCFGGLISHLMGLEFRSPFVNMYLSESDYIKVLNDLYRYMHRDIKFIRMEYEQNLKRDFPVFEFFDGVTLKMNHYVDVDEARKKWHKRKNKINWYNILVVMYTDNPSILEEFDKLPFAKKICFVPFETDVDCAFVVKNEKNNNPNMQTWEFANYYAINPFHYDPFDLLLYGIKNDIK